jgi:formylglycine-generating enzyme required for sulfatase activity
MNPIARTTAILVLTLGFAASAFPRGVLAGENYALLVAVSDYDEKELRPLKFTRADILEFHETLAASGFAPKNIVLMHDDLKRLVTHYEALGAEFKPRDYQPSGASIRKELELLLGRLRAEDSVIVAFAGHGVQFKADKKSYFCPSDARLDRKDSLIAFEDVFAALKDCAAGRKLFLVDACQNDPQSEISRSRSTVDLDSVTRPQSEPVPEGIIALFSCKAGQKAFEHPPLGHGVFFYHLLDGWKGTADLNGDGKLSYQELAVYTERKTAEYASVRLKVLQTPQLRSDFSGEWILRELEKPNLPPPLFDAKLGKTAAQAKASQEAWAKHLKTGVETENSLGMRLRLIPPGEYKRGSTPADIDAVVSLDATFEKKYGDNEQPQHTVRLTKAFRLGATEVTRGQFRRFVNATKYVTEAEKDDGGLGYNVAVGKLEGRDKKFNWKNTGFAQTDEHPVVNVTWNDAKAFVEWLSKEEGIEYRLPTEAEWEYACRAGTTGMFSVGNTFDALDGIANVADQSTKRIGQNFAVATFEDGFQFTAPAGKLKTNGFGLADMHGNVWEWCGDWYDTKEYSKHAGVTVEDPNGPSLGVSNRVLRGGGWFRAPVYCRSAGRSGLTPDFRLYDLGFRVLTVQSFR